MSLVCQCPASTALATIPAFTCGDNFGQIQKVAFERLYYVGSSGDRVKNKFALTATTGIKKLSAWTTKLAATDATKIVISPFLEAPAEDGGDPITFGGGNETRNGVTVIVGANPINFSAALRGVPQEVIKIMKTLQCEAQAGNLGVYLFNANGQIEGITDHDSTGESVYPIPIQSLFIGDKIHGGLENLDQNTIQWSYPQNYSDDLIIVTPEFDPLTDLVPSSSTD